MLKCRRNRDIDVVVRILNLDAFKFLLFHVGVGQDTDDGQPLVIDLDLLSEHVAETEQFLLGSDPEHADLAVVAFIRGKEETALEKVQILNCGICAADAEDPTVGAPGV